MTSEIIPTKRDENGFTYFQVDHDLIAIFDPEDTWVEIRDLSDEYQIQAAIISTGQIDRLIETLKRIKRMAPTVAPMTVTDDHHQSPPATIS